MYTCTRHQSSYPGTTQHPSAIITHAHTPWTHTCLWLISPLIIRNQFPAWNILKTSQMWCILRQMRANMFFMSHSSLEGASWRWSCRTLWRAVRLSSVSRRVRQWSCWSGPATGRAGVWCGPRTRLLLRRVWCPAALCASLTPAAVWKWTAFSHRAKVRTCFFNFDSLCSAGSFLRLLELYTW